MAPSQAGPRGEPVNTDAYARVIHVATPASGQGDGSPANPFASVGQALAGISDAAVGKRYAILVAAGTYNESRVAMKPYVDLYGGFAAGDFNARDVYKNASILDAQKKGPVVIGADNARLDGFVVTGGEVKAHGAGILCDGVSPIIVNNVITSNRTLKPDMKEGLGNQVANEGAGIALLSGSRAEVINNLICDNSTEIGAGAGIAIRGNVQAKVRGNVLCNNTSGLKDNAQFHGKEGSRSSPGAGIACSDNSSPDIAFNVVVMGTALYAHDAGGIIVQGNSVAAIHDNWIAGNTAYDDGGAIYVMGAITYDDKGERHDAPPDAPVKIEDNLIAGNDAVLGAPGGVRVSKKGQAELRRNRLLNNARGGALGAQGGVITVMENNIESYSTRIRISAEISGRKFDPVHHVTEFTTTKALEGADLSGAAVCIGKQWSIIRSNTPSSVMVWGKITDESMNFEVLDESE
jgi:predicted outer membrane repeat protein